MFCFLGFWYSRVYVLLLYNYVCLFVAIFLSSYIFDVLRAFNQCIYMVKLGR